MDADRRRAGSRLADVPAVTVANLAVAVLALPLLAALDRASLLSLGPVEQVAARWVVVVVVLATAVAAEGQSLADVGFRRPSPADAGYLVAAAVLALAVFAATDPLVEALGLPVSGDSGTVAAGATLGVALANAVTTGIVEEVLFRGYPVERLLAHADSALVAGGLSWVAFTVAHAAVWPAGNLLQIAAVAAVFTAVYVRRRTLAPVVGAHVLVWVFSVLGQFYG